MVIVLPSKGGAMNPVRLDPQGPFKRDPLAPHRMRDRQTRTQDVFVLCHLGVARIERDRWSLAIDGMVEHPRTLRFDDLTRYSKTEVASVHQCCGSPLAPFEPTRRVCNVRWGGVRLADVLADCRPSESARYIWSYGADFGKFGGVAVDAYIKDLPIARVETDVLIGYEMNGSPLPADMVSRPASLFRVFMEPTASNGSPESGWSKAGRWLHSPPLVQRPGAGRRRPRNRRNHAGLVDRARVTLRLADTQRGDRAVGRAGNMGLGLGGWRGSQRLYPRRRRSDMATRRARAAARTRVAALLDALDAEAAWYGGARFTGRGNGRDASVDIRATQRGPSRTGERHLTRVPAAWRLGIPAVVGCGTATIQPHQSSNRVAQSICPESASSFVVLSN
jgi:Oxidoreductase molybdopterin binding domain